MSDFVFGYPYYSLLHGVDGTINFNDFARTGRRRSFANYPWFVDAKSGHIIVSERDGNRLQFFDNVGNECRFEPFGTPGHGVNQFFRPGGVTTTHDPLAAVIVSDTGNRRITLFRVVSDFHGYGLLEQNYTFGHEIFSSPMGLEYDVRRKYLLVCDNEARRVTIHDLRTGQCIGQCRPPSDKPLCNPIDVAIDDINGLAYVTDANTHTVHVYDRSGDFVSRFGCCGDNDGQFNKPWGICFDRDERLLIADEGNNRIVMHQSRSGGPIGEFVKEVACCTYGPKGVSINRHENVVVTCGDPSNFLRIFKYK